MRGGSEHNQHNKTEEGGMYYLLHTENIGAYNHNCQLWVTHQSAERHAMAQKN